eukprot:CAMPEP_0115216104 /NCGR_PEP_ID=MMETSP0270-20121206/25167_1 /TAXON_ID=71861 /ORGANISM="Scrippsiella trochoidea, Strain CCMP3099" /LENGTH=60 /DNA_ID=CAMNT_0002629933 /DNA_START=367 /DNA_END=549 /DNA_ORIENTATION=-
MSDAAAGAAHRPSILGPRAARSADPYACCKTERPNLEVRRAGSSANSLRLASSRSAPFKT